MREGTLGHTVGPDGRLRARHSQSELSTRCRAAVRARRGMTTWAHPWYRPRRPALPSWACTDPAGWHVYAAKCTRSPSTSRRDRPVLWRVGWRDLNESPRPVQLSRALTRRRRAACMRLAWSAAVRRRAFTSSPPPARGCWPSSGHGGSSGKHSYRPILRQIRRTCASKLTTTASGYRPHSVGEKHATLDI